MQHLLTGFPLPTSPGLSWIITLVLECPGKLQLSWKMGKQDQIMISGSDNPADKCQSFVVQGLSCACRVRIPRASTAKIVLENVLEFYSSLWKPCINDLVSCFGPEERDGSWNEPTILRGILALTESHSLTGERESFIIEKNAYWTV